MEKIAFCLSEKSRPPSPLKRDSRMSVMSRTRPRAGVCRFVGAARLGRRQGMGALANLLDIEGRVLRKADGLATRGLALLDRDAKYWAHRAITRAYGVIEHGHSRIVRRPTDAAAVYGKIARGYYGLSNPLSAWRAAQEGIAFDGRNPDVLEILGLIQLDRGQSKEALASFERALKSAPHGPPLLAYRGDAAVAAGQGDHASASYLQGVALAPDDTDNYEKLLRLTPPDAEAWIPKAGAHPRKEEADDSLHALDPALPIAPDRGAAWA